MSDASTATKIEILEMARDRIQLNWTKGELGAFDKPDGPVCAIGGVLAGINFHPETKSDYLKAGQVQSELRNELAHSIGANTERGVMAFNDMPWRMKGGVVRIFNRTIRRYRRREVVEQMEQELRELAAEHEHNKQLACRYETMATQVERNIAVMEARVEQIEMEVTFNAILQERGRRRISTEMVVECMDEKELLSV
jgi:hypothetical protein